MNKPDYEVTQDCFIPGNWMIWDGRSPLGDTYATEAEALAEVRQLERRNRFWNWVIIATVVPFMMYYFWHTAIVKDWPPLEPDQVEMPDNGYDLD